MRTPGWGLVRLFNYDHSFTNHLSLGSLQSEGYCLAGFRRSDTGSFLLHALDRGLKVVSVGIRTNPEHDWPQRPKIKIWKDLHDSFANFDAPAGRNAIHNGSDEWYRPDLGDGVLRKRVRVGR